MAIPSKGGKAEAQTANRFFAVWDLIRELVVYSAIVPPTLLAIFSYLLAVLTGRQKRFKPDNDISDLSGKVVLVTGANTGIGKETVLQLAKHGPAKIFLAARNETKALSAIADIKKATPKADITFIQLDLTTFSSIADAAQKVLESCNRLDILILNAGIMATPWNLTRDGFETQLGTNHLGHALLTKLLLPIMVKTAELPDADIRIVSVSSIGHNMAPKGGILFDQEAMKGLTPAQLYGQSKLANILYVKALAKRHPQITAVAVHPGLIRTDLYDPVARDIWLVRFALKAARPLVFSDVGYGALNQLWAAAVGKESVQNGAYYMPVGKPIGASPYTNDEQLADKLWDWTEKQFTRHATGNKTTKSS